MKKKIIMIIFSLVTIVLSYNIYKLFITKHTVNYKANKYEITESYYKNNSGHFYDIVIKNAKLSITYTLNENLRKQKKIIEEIKTYRNNDVICIQPIYKKSKNNNLYCTLDNRQVSNYYLESTENAAYEEILSKLKISIKDKKETKNTYKKLTVYQNNISDTQTYVIWDYKGIYLLNKAKTNYQKILDYDLYDNIMATVTTNYFVLFENTSVNGIKTVYYYDLNKEKLYSFDLNITLEKDSYINGTLDNEVYVTDLKNKKQYKIIINKKKIVEVDEDQTNYFTYDNNKKINLSKSDYFLEKQLFNNKLLTNEEITSSGELKKEYNYYYFYENNRFYKALDNNLKYPILLFEMNDISDWYIVDRGIVLVKEDTLYYYDDMVGLNKILESNELKYNYKNIYYLWKN